MLSNPPPIAQQFLHDLRRMISASKERLKSRRHIPKLSAIDELEDEKEEHREAAKQREMLPLPPTEIYGYGKVMKEPKKPATDLSVGPSTPKDQEPKLENKPVGSSEASPSPQLSKKSGEDSGHGDSREDDSTSSESKSDSTDGTTEAEKEKSQESEWFDIKLRRTWKWLTI